MKVIKCSDRNCSVEIILTLLVLMLCTLFFWIDIDVSFEIECGIDTIIAIICYVWILVSSPVSKGKINLYKVFMTLTIPFYFGAQILLLLGYRDRMSKEYYSFVDGRIGEPYIIEAMHYVIFGILFIHLGYLICNPKNIKTNKIANHEDGAIVSCIDKIATVLVFVTVIPTFAAVLYDVNLANTYGRLMALQIKNEANYLGIWFLFMYIQGWFLPACYMKLVTGKSRKLIYILLAVYSILYLATGSRYEVIQIVFAVFVIEIVWHKKKINKNQFLKWLLIGYIGIVFLSSISVTRQNVGSAISFNNFFELLGSGVLYEVLFETGSTFTSISNMLKYCPELLPYNYGMSYLGGVIYILPGFLRPSFFDEIILHTSAQLSPLYYGHDLAGYGSSFIGEIYYNFGPFSYVALILFGCLLCKITAGISRYGESRKTVKFIIVLYVLTELVWGIRADIYLIPRHLFYYVLLPMIIAKFVADSKK